LAQRLPARALDASVRPFPMVAHPLHITWLMVLWCIDQKEYSMATPYRIVVALDFSDCSGLAFEEAIAIAKRSTDPELHIVSVINKEASDLVPAEDRHASMVQISDHLRERLMAEALRVLRANAATSLRAIAHVRLGAIAQELCNLATEIRADLVVVGTHGRQGVQRLLLGSVAEKTVRMAPCPVLVVRPKDFHAMDGLPQIEPTCPLCLKVRQESAGAKWWCDGHITAPASTNTYSHSARLDEPPEVSPYRS
jgi:nucleotide-binding universal stress UspA family protein